MPIIPPPYIVAANENGLLFEVPQEADTIHQLWYLDLATETWSLFRDWTQSKNTEPGNPMANVEDGPVGLVATNNLACIRGATSDVDAAASANNYGGSVALIAGMKDPAVTSIGFASTKNFVLSNRALAYYQRIGLVRLLQRYV